MKLFSAFPFTKHCHTMAQAEDVAKAADDIIKNDGTVIFGKYRNGKLVELSEEQKPGDTVALFAFAPKMLKELSPHR